jgi:hypothetical protein
MYIPAKIEKTISSSTYMPQKVFVDFNATYVPLKAYGLADRLQIKQLTDDQVEKLTTQLTDYTNVPIKHLQEKLQRINTDYPWEMPTWGMVLITIGGTIFSLLKLILIVWCCYKCQMQKASAKASVVTIGTPVRPNRKGRVPANTDVGKASASRTTSSASTSKGTVSSKALPPVPYTMTSLMRAIRSPFKKTDKATPTVRYDATSEAIDITITPEILEEARQQLEEEGVVFHKKSASKTKRT